MTREGGGHERWSPEALELPRVGKGVPKTLLQNGILAHDREGERGGVLGHRSKTAIMPSPVVLTTWPCAVSIAVRAMAS